MNVISDPLNQWLSHMLDMPAITETNPDICPSQSMTVLHKAEKDQQCYTTESMTWGIQPAWAKRLLINAQAETAATKTTFKNAMHTRRCVVPCSGWYEWSTISGSKQKYLFRPSQGEGFLMAGLYFPPPANDPSQPSQFVTLTIHPNPDYARYHHRMPLLILPENLDYWMHSDVDRLAPLLLPVAPGVVVAELV
tara:strand:+ start:4086 stop:4667 length:582 start_codon:yes stop_codon:yes gene_type:complete